MAKVTPFTAIRYRPGAIENLVDVLAPPYDVISPEEQKELYERHSRNVVRLILGEQSPDDTDDDNRYTRSAAFLEQWLGDGTLERVDKPALYLYAQEYDLGGRRLNRTGFICRVKLEAFGEGSIFRHERTLSGPKVDRLNLTRACRTNFSQVFGLYADPDNALDAKWAEVAQSAPEVDVTDGEGVRHRMWVIRDEGLVGEVRRFMNEKPIVIADGHHRYETALNYRNERRAADGDPEGERDYDYVMMYLSNIHSQGFTVLPTHRLVTDIETVDTATLKAGLEKYFDVTEREVTADGLDSLLDELARRGEQATSFGCYAGDGKGFLLSLKPGAEPESSGGAADAALAKLDVYILQELIFEKTLGVSKEAVASKKNVSYTPDARAAVAAVDAGRANLAFLMNSTSVEQVMEVATNGGVMPQKSTYFYPKLISGLVFNPLG